MILRPDLFEAVLMALRFENFRYNPQLVRVTSISDVNMLTMNVDCVAGSGKQSAMSFKIALKYILVLIVYMADENPAEYACHQTGILPLSHLLIDYL